MHNLLARSVTCPHALQFGRQAFSRHNNPATSCIGVAKRFQGAAAAEGGDNACGPGQYPVLRARLSSLSTRGPEPPATAFRTDTRKQEVYLQVRIAFACDQSPALRSHVACNLVIVSVL
jgi:hypothetical protein